MMLWLETNGRIKKKNLLKFAAEIIWAQTAIIGGNLSYTTPRHNNGQTAINPSQPLQDWIVKVLQLRIALLSESVFKSSYFVWFWSIIRSQACAMSFKEKPTVHATVIWDSVTINNIFVLSPLSSKAGHYHIHASLSIILAIDNI